MTPLICPKCRALHGRRLERCIVDGLFLEPALPDPWLGRVLDQRYRLEGVIADGERSRVYAARDAATDRRLAVKLLLSEHSRSADHATRFLREIEIARHLDHPSILELVDAGVVAGSAYLVAQRVTGPSLAERLATAGALPPAEATSLFAQLCAAVAAMHAAGVVHRSLDASRVLLDGPERALVHGLASASRRCHRGPAHTERMPAVRATATSEPQRPEDRDLFALGVILETMLARDDEAIASRLDRRAPALDHVCSRLTSPDPARRYASVVDVLADVDASRSTSIR